MTKKMALSVLVKLVDRVSGPLERIVGRIRGLSAAANIVRNLTGRIGELSQRIGALGTIGAGLSFVAPLKAAADMDKIVRDVAITQGVSFAQMEENVTRLTKRYESLALTVGQRSRDMAISHQILAGAGGISDADIDVMLPQIGRAATAAGADIAAMARLAISVFQNLKVPAEQMERQFAALAVAGKLGGVELKDMAHVFPVLTAQMANLGVVGPRAVAFLASLLQIAKRGAASPEEAANNTLNFMTKLLSEETIKKFTAHGVDIEGTMKGALFKRLNPVEAALEKILKLTGMSDKEYAALKTKAKTEGFTDAEIHELGERIRSIHGAGKIAGLFGDMQVKNFVIPVLGAVKELKETEAKVLEAMAADPKTGVLADDWRSRMAGLDKQMERFGEIGEQAARRVGTAFATHLKTANDAVETLMSTLKRFDERAPGAVDQALSWVGGILAGVVALGVLGQVLGWISGGLAVFGIAALGWPVLLAAAIAGAIVAMIQHWEAFESFFKGLAERVGRMWDDMIPGWVRGLLRGGIAALPGGALLSHGLDALSSMRRGPNGFVPVGGNNGFAPVTAGALASEQKVGGRIGVEVTVTDQRVGARARVIESDSRDVPLTVDRGLMLGMP